MELRTEIEIQAPMEKVWQHLTDFDSFPTWNPFIRSAKGEIKPGSSLEISIQPAGSKALTFKPKVLKLEKNRELRWLGRFIIPGLFDGEHIFTIEPIAYDRVRFIHRESFSGLLVPFLAKDLNTNTKKGFEAMNQALKIRAEQAE
ncbi:MAG: SRPBCC domain-containing protein [Xenococcaceae cyanobacterium MO_167.B27]|nr:SRPBCC domain-containing protein [Xenococcaceae cyanobacterium MO_167.B27]